MRDAVRALLAGALVAAAGCSAAAPGAASPGAAASPGTAAPAAAAPGTASPGAAGSAPPGIAGILPRSCTVPADAELRARLAGDVEGELDWRGTALACEGMPRPDRLGLRVVFAGELDGEPTTVVFGAPRLAEGADGDGVAVNLTVLRAGRIYGTRGDDRCTLDRVRQTALDPAGTVPRRWRIEARGFCLEPARALAGDANGAILLATFDFIGLVTWDPAPPPDAPPARAR